MGGERAPYAALAAVVLYIVMFTGITSGIQGMFDPFLERGVFADLCHGPNVTLPCPAQKRAMAASVDAMLSVVNVFVVCVGITVDVLGGQRSALVFITMGSVAIAASGIAPGSGGLYVTCIIITGVSNSGGFLTMVTRYLPGLLTDPRQLQLWSGIMTGLWDVSGAMGNVIGLFVSVRALPLFAITLLCGAGIGLPLFIIFAGPMRRKLDACEAAKVQMSAEASDSADPHEEALNDDAVALPPASAPTLRSILSAGLVAAKFALRQPIYHMIVGNTIAVVLFGNAFIAYVGEFVRWKGATLDEEKAMRVRFNIMLACGGAAPWVVSPLLARLPVRQARFAGAVYQTVLLALAVVGALALPVHAQYLTFACVIVWRILYYALINGAILAELESCGAALGTLFGLTYWLAGVVSLAVGPVISSALAHAPDHAWSAIIGVWAGVSVLSIVGLVVCPSAQRLDTQAGDGDGEPDADVPMKADYVADDV